MGARRLVRGASGDGVPAPLALPGGPTLATTGAEALPAALGACLLLLAVALARRRTRAS